MTRRRAHRLLSRAIVVTVLSAVAVLAASAAVTEVVDTTLLAKQLEAQRSAEHQALRDAGQSAPQAHRPIDDKYLKLAQQNEPARSRQVTGLESKSGVQGLGQGPGGTDPARGRGVLGDIDTRSLSAREFDAVMKAAQEMGYTVVGQGDYRTIREINTTIHRQASPYGSPLGSSARDAELARGYGKETAYGLENPDPNVRVMDNLKKALHTLDEPAEMLSGESLQELGKMTGRNLDAGLIEDPALRQQADLLKKGYTPESAGIVRPKASAAERLKQGIESGGQARCPKCGEKVTFEVIRETKPTPVTVYKCKRCGRGTLSTWEFVRAHGKTHYAYQQERMPYGADRIDAVAKQFEGK